MQSKASKSLLARREAGVLLHISSLPSPEGIGTFGEEAFKTADWIAKAGFSLWQILPTGPTGFGNSPYAPHSSFAGNELFIDLADLCQKGYLEHSDCDKYTPKASEKVNFSQVKADKILLLKKAANSFIQKAGLTEAGYQEFVAQEGHWLDSYALFRVLSERFGDNRWYSHWPKEYANRDKDALSAFIDSHQTEIERWKVLQYFFALQWQEFRSYVNKLGIKLIGDVPIFVAGDSADTWANPHLFKRNTQGQFDPVSGVPPDLFSSTGQLWGNPVYDWDELERTHYHWWVLRLQRLFALTDLLRIDHFRGLIATWEIPASDSTAEFGSWIDAGGKELFEELSQHFDMGCLIAEDLGLMDDEVIGLRDAYGLPGMKIFQFGFTFDEDGNADYTHEFLPPNWSENFVVYTGTHDNDTTAGWFESLNKSEREVVLNYLDCSEEEVTKAMIRMMLFSVARMAIIPVQDLLNKDTKARFNYPSSCNEENWSWRVQARELTNELAKRMKDLLTISARL